MRSELLLGGDNAELAGEEFAEDGVAEFGEDATLFLVGICFFFSGAAAVAHRGRTRRFLAIAVGKAG